MKSLKIWGGVSALSVAVTANAAVNILVNGDFEALPILGVGQSDLDEGASKWTTIDPAGPAYVESVSGMVGWTYGLDFDRDPPNVHTDIGPTRAASYAGGRAMFSNRWERMVHQTAGAVEASKTYEAELFVDSVGAVQAGRLMLIAGAIDQNNELTPGSIVLSERSFGTTDWVNFTPDQLLIENEWMGVGLEFHAPDSGLVVGMPLIFAFEIAEECTGFMNFDAASLIVVPAPCTLGLVGLGGLASLGRRRG